MYELASGESTRDKRLDRSKQYDLRSLNYLVRDVLEAEEYHKPRSYTWSCEKTLDQGPLGACTGFGLAHELIARPVKVQNVDGDFAKLLYFEAQRIDPWEGGEYPDAQPWYAGSSVLAAMQVGKRLGYMDEYRWALDIHDLIATVGYFGPVIIGVDWYEKMLDVDDLGFIRPQGRIVGGHCILMRAVKVVKDGADNIDYNASYFTLRNSWGPTWGIQESGKEGDCRIAMSDMMLLIPGGDFAVPVHRRDPARRRFNVGGSVDNLQQLTI